MENIAEPLIPAENITQFPPNHEDLFDFEKAKIRMQKLIGEWSADFAEADSIRKERYIDIDSETLQELGELKKGEILIPIRNIDANIRTKKSDVMTFLNAGYRLGIFECVSDPSVDSRQLELEVTKGLTYPGWNKEFDRVADGAGLFSRDYIEVVFDETKPLHVGLEHVGFDKLIFNRKVNDIQDSEQVLRAYEVTVFRLEDFVKNNGFDAIQVDKIVKAKEHDRDTTICIYKRYCKCYDVVYVSWYCKECGVTDWLKKPEPLRLGIANPVEETDPLSGEVVSSSFQEADVDIYPIFTNVDNEDEQEVLVDKKGRAFLDRPLQNASTAIVSSFVNRQVKAGFIFGSPKQEDDTSGEMKQLDLQLKDGGMYSKPIEWWSLPPPDVSVLISLQYLDSKNAEQRGKPAYSVSNRKDARKTAKEFDVAEKEQGKLTSTNLATFSEFLRDVLNFSWRIIQSQALQNKITLLLKQDSMSGMWTNDVETIGQQFDIRPAGDTDVIEAQNEQEKMMMDWPVVQTTPLGPVFLQDYIKLRYPKKANEYIQILQAGVDMGKNLVASLSALLQQALTPEEVATLPPDQQQQLAMIQQQVTQYLGQQNAQPGATTEEQPVPGNAG